MWTMFLALIFAAPSANAAEVGKGMIPKDQLVNSYKELSWKVKIWDVKEAVDSLKKNEKALWVDTRPTSFYEKGSVRGAVNLDWDKTGSAENTLSDKALQKALADAGITKESGKIIFFCQGPECHRSYNASFVAVTQWGYKPENIIWFRAGYPPLLDEVKKDAALKRKAKSYISDAGMKEL